MATRKKTKTPRTKVAAKKAKAPPTKKAKGKLIPTKKAKGKPRPTQQTKADSAAELDGLLDAALFPTARAYAEEELHILSVARKHPKLGDRFIRDATRRVETKIPKKDRPAFLAAMSKVDVEARAEIVVGKMAEYWGVPLDAETKEDVRDDVRAMYAGD